VLTLPYALPYLAATRELGPRPSGEVLMFSADWGSYLAAPHQNWLWGWTAWGYGGNERHLFPGIASVLLAVAGLAWKPRRMVWIYAALTLLAVDLSLGLNSTLYRWLYEHTFVFRGFRAPARFAILACCAMSVMAGFGYTFLRRVIAASPARRALLTIVLVVVAVESGSSPLELTAQPTAIPPVYRFLRTVAPSVILELPARDYEPTYMFWSTYHWHWLVNGYSGYTPGDHLDNMTLMLTFPDDESVARLRELGARYVLVHQALYRPAEFSDLMSAIAERAELIPVGRYRDWLAGDTQIIELRK
jgi:hypothetical protein